MLLAQTLALLSTEAQLGGADFIHWLAESARGAFADRIRHVGDPSAPNVGIGKTLDWRALIEPARMAARKATMSLERTTPAWQVVVPESGTSHLSVLDAEGSAVALTTTVNDAFGARIRTADGFLLNNELDDFTPDRVVERFGLAPQQAPNRPRPGARPVSSMTPTIVLMPFSDEPEVVRLVIGGSGGMRIATGVTQVLVRHLGGGQALNAAIASPRFHSDPMGPLFLDEGLMQDEALVQRLRLVGEDVQLNPMVTTGVQAVAVLPGQVGQRRRVQAAADPRKGGAALP